MMSDTIMSKKSSAKITLTREERKKLIRSLVETGVPPSILNTLLAGYSMKVTQECYAMLQAKGLIPGHYLCCAG